MAKFAGGSTYNFGLGVSGQTNGFFIPEVYSKKVQIALRKAAVAEAICNTDYMGEISSFGDTVNIIKDLEVKGAGFTAKRGTAVRNISLPHEDETHIEGRVNGVKIMILTQYLKKA